jgi:hypothetical protein
MIILRIIDAFTNKPFGDNPDAVNFLIILPMRRG